jgi:hypothetical protein
MRRFQIALGRNTSVCLFTALGGLGLCSCSSSSVDSGNPAGGGAATQAGTSGSTQTGAGTGSSTGGSGAQTAGTSSGTSGTGSAVAGTGGVSGGADAGGNAGGNAGGGATAGSGGSGDPSKLDKFSFFVTSMVAMRKLSNSQDGFGGDLRYGTADGLTGADKICTEVAESAMPGAGAKQWHAFLSTVKGPVNAKDRIGAGPWYDRAGRLVAMNLTELLQDRPNADAAIKQDLPNETGTPNHRPNPNAPEDDNHHTLTGSKPDGTLYNQTATCMDWTSSSRDNVATGRPRIGFSWSVPGRTNWISGQDEGGCGAGVAGEASENGPSDPKNPIVGSGGGYGGIYCFALVP